MANKTEQAYQLMESSLLKQLIKDHISDTVSRWITTNVPEDQARYHALVNATLDIEHYITEKCREILNDGSAAE